MNSSVIFGLSLALALAGLWAEAQATEPSYTMSFGPLNAQFNVSSSEVSGPAGTTPPGATISVEDSNTLALEASLHFDKNWSATLAFGIPPRVRFIGMGSAAALGEIGSARVWSPTLLVAYRFDSVKGIRPFVAAGLNHPFYTDVNVGNTYTTAFGGDNSSGNISASFGPVLKMGVEVPFADAWVLSAGLARVGVCNKATITTQTPGVGNVVREVTLRSDPNVFTLLIGRSL